MTNTELFNSIKTGLLRPDGTNWTMAAGTGDTLNSDALAITGFEEVAIKFATGAMTATGTLDAKLQVSSDGGSTWADVVGGALTQILAASGANKIYGWDAIRVKPGVTHIRAVLTRATANVVITSMTYYLAAPRTWPVTQPTGTGGVGQLKMLINPSN